MIATNEELDLWRVSLKTGRKLIVAYPREAWDVPISEIKPLLINELNEKLGCELVCNVKYYGKATDVQMANRNFNKSVLKNMDYETKNLH